MVNTMCGSNWMANRPILTVEIERLPQLQASVVWGTIGRWEGGTRAAADLPAYARACGWELNPGFLMEAQMA